MLLWLIQLLVAAATWLGVAPKQPSIEDAAAAWVVPTASTLLAVRCDDSDPAVCTFYWQHLPPMTAHCTVRGCTALTVETGQ